tara:strand:- start:3182 stop:3484 length:303 start_codon:yes stop_codon:yes gene_type:complete
MNYRLIHRGDKDFEPTLDFLEKKYFHNGGGPDAEEIWNKCKQEVKEDGWVSFYGTNSQVSNLIKRNRIGIKAVRYDKDGAELFYDSKHVKSFFTMVKIRK